MTTLLLLITTLWAKSVNQCIVGGHGPYDETPKMCLYLAQQQAETNCKLTDAPATVEYTWENKKKKIKGECHTDYRAASRDCKPTSCH